MGVVLEPGAVIGGRYQLDRVLGQGGMGVVWAAVHTVTRKRVALKFLRGPSHIHADLRRRFLREARAASAIVHPNVVEVHDVFELEDSTPVMVMDLLDGETLGHKLAREGALGLEEAASILLPVVSAVGTAHSIGVVHRDLKPDNVFLGKARTGDRDVRVLDFGIAKLVGTEGGAAETGVITGTGSVLGTPCYMSPEQAFGEKLVDHRADVWAIGVVLYEALAGSRPVDGDSIGQVVKRLVTDAITPLEVLRPDLPRDVLDLVGRMLSREKEGRPGDLREVLAVLRRHTTVVSPDFGPAAGEGPTSGDIPEPLGSSQRVVVAHATADPSARTHDATPTGPETAQPHTVTGAPSRGALRWWHPVAALAAAAISLGVWSRSQQQPDASPVDSAAITAIPAGSPTGAAPASVTPSAASLAPPIVAPAPESPAAPGAAAARPSASTRTEPAPAGTARPRVIAPPASSTRVAAPPSPEVPAPAPAAPPPSPKRGGLAEQVPF